MPSIIPILGVGGLTMQPALTIAQDTLISILAPKMGWKWNRVAAPTFYSVAWQQDYSTSLTNVSWLEHANETAQISATPLPIRGVSCVRDLPISSSQDRPTAVCWLPNSIAVTGSWAASTLFTSSVGNKNLPNSPINQIRDSNGGLQQVTTYGTTGATEPTWSTTVGETTTDGTVVWTLLDPNGITLRLNSVLPDGSLSYFYNVWYQEKPTTYTSLSDMIGVPDELSNVYREMFMAQCFRHAGDPRWVLQERKAVGVMAEMLGAADRERDWYSFVPDIGPIGG